MICSLVVASRGDELDDFYTSLEIRFPKKLDKIDSERDLEAQSMHEHFDSMPERMLCSELAKRMPDLPGYKLTPKVVVKRYTWTWHRSGPERSTSNAMDLSTN